MLTYADALLNPKAGSDGRARNGAVRRLLVDRLHAPRLARRLRNPPQEGRGKPRRVRDAPAVRRGAEVMGMCVTCEVWGYVPNLLVHST